MAVRVCTSIWGTAWERYGEKFAKSFTNHWDKSIELCLTVDNNYYFDRNTTQIYLDETPEYVEFMDKWTSNPMYPEDMTGDAFSKWKHDIVKWTPQAITPKVALDNNPHWIDGDILIWTDADSEFYSDVDEAWVERVLDGKEVAALFRPTRHTEIGFFVLRLNENTRNFMNRWAELFTTYEIIDYEEWHSGYAWDIAIKEFDLTLKNLNNTGSNGHPFPDSILAEKIRHDKGHLKGPYEGTI